MKWGQLYAVRSYLRSALWVIPVGAYLASFIVIRILSAVDDALGWTWHWTMEITVVQNVLQGMVAATVTFLVFAFSSLLVAIQVASAQLSPRIIATTLLRDRNIRFIVALFVLTVSFDLGTLVRSQTHVPYLLLTVAIVFAGGSTVAFVYLIDHAARLLRPVSIVWRLGEAGIEVVEQVYPRRIGHTDRPSRPRPDLSAPMRAVVHGDVSAIVLAVDLRALVAEAERTGGIIEFTHQIGDFVSVGEPIFLLYGGAASAEDHVLQAAIAMGPERTIEQDATFAFRIIVDIAIKALSKAINDPTTAVLAIDQLHRLLRAVGRRHLHDDVVRDAAGNARLVFRTPDWADFVQLACREIRLYGVENYQVSRRMRAMLENLMQILPETRRAALRKELELLDCSLERLNLQPDDLELARVSDFQGLGGASRKRPAP
jgi:uncharacterized membrane protein